MCFALCQRFQELNDQREKIETLIANGLECIVEQERCIADLQRHREYITSSGVVSQLTRVVNQWRLQTEDFKWSKYVCHAPDCHCNCDESAVVSPFASLWCFFNVDCECQICHHSYGQHRVSRDGWVKQEVTETTELGNDLAEAERVLNQSIEDATTAKLRLAQELDTALTDYEHLGLRNAYVHLLRSQKAVLEERLQTRPDDATLKSVLISVLQSLKAVEEAAEASCCICFEHLANTKLLPCNHAQFCADCASGLGTCPLCRGMIEDRVPVSGSTDSSGYGASSGLGGA